MNFPKHLFVPLVAAAVIVTGCGSAVTYVATDNVALAPKPQAYDMPVSASPAARPHRSLGELRVSVAIEPSYRQTSTLDQAVEQMKKEARKRGADAVVDLKTLDDQINPARGRLTLAGTLVIYTSPMPAGTAGGSRRK